MYTSSIQYLKNVPRHYLVKFQWIEHFELVANIDKQFFFSVWFTIVEDNIKSSFASLLHFCHIAK